MLLVGDRSEKIVMKVYHAHGILLGKLEKSNKSLQIHKWQWKPNDKFVCIHHKHLYVEKSLTGTGPGRLFSF